MPWILWREAFRFAVEVVNVSPSRALGGKTPYTRRFKERPNVELLPIWGCIVHVFTPKVLQANKLENTGKLGMFVGFAKHSESIQVLNLRTGKIQEQRSVVFDEGWTGERSYVEHLLQ
ncbi:Polyprotein [Phytophthora palmivora]|uniref:Polyprotein n=1 Tax=Phytophthora palmivora TaxID=4796 RepID=A0A2P4XGS2_9STRA|nr:Polyprotein [Phytophthora palmivora]